MFFSLSISFIAGVSNELNRSFHVHGISEHYFGDDNVSKSQINSFISETGDITKVKNSHRQNNDKTNNDETTSQRISGFIQSQIEDTAESAAVALAAAISDVSSNEQILYFENANIPNIGTVKCKLISLLSSFNFSTRHSSKNSLLRF